MKAFLLYHTRKLLSTTVLYYGYYYCIITESWYLSHFIVMIIV